MKEIHYKHLNQKGVDNEKMAQAGLTPVYADNSVYFAEAKLFIICKKIYASELPESGFINMIAVQKKEKPIILFDSATLWFSLYPY